MRPSDEATEVDGIPILARRAALESSGPVVVVLHGMSTTPEMLRTGWPDTVDDGLARVYWRLPVLREGREAILARRARDPFRDLFYALFAQTRDELPRLLDALGDRPVGVLGFSIGGFLSLWSAQEARVGAAVSIGGVPNFDYLRHYLRDYDWQDDEVRALCAAADLWSRLPVLRDTATLILHGQEDAVAQWAWMAPFATALRDERPAEHPYRVYPAVQHRLVAESTAEAADLASLKSYATTWLREALRPVRVKPSPG